MNVLPPSFYLRSDPILIAKELIGKWLFTKFPGEITTGGMIIETEAYAGPWDLACHAFNNRNTKRTNIMFEEGGVAYIYLCYGLHHMLNVVTSLSGIPHAILIRAIHPEYGIKKMLERRGKQISKQNLANGPGSLCQALGIDINLNGHSLAEPPLWIEDRSSSFSSKEIQSSPRIGIKYAKSHASLPWRFFIK
ncbi:MAG: DNA-3-methyladenine glycosylase [Chlamydiae bacterium]|nr:DNA-3-methyladenine glycosylase [Chlamydiota bacterium]